MAADRASSGVVTAPGPASRRARLTHGVRRAWSADTVTLALPFVVIAADLLIAVFTGPGLRWLSMMAAAPALAVARYRPRAVIGIGVLALVVSVLLGLRSGSPSGQNQTAVLAAVAAVTAAGALLSAQRERRHQELLAVRSVAEAVQQAILAPVPERIGPLRIHVSYSAAAAEATVGGDLYGALDTPFGPRALIADVRGKGLPAVSTAALVLGIFREAAYDEPDLLDVVARLEKSLNRNLKGEDFVTALLVGYPTPDRLEMVNCGHVQPLHVHEGEVTTLVCEPPTPPLGLLGLGGGRPTRASMPIAEGDWLLLYTDGVTEARDADGRFFPLPAEFRRTLTDDPAQTLRLLDRRLLDHSGGSLGDDAAMLLIESARGTLRGPAPRGSR